MQERMQWPLLRTAQHRKWQMYMPAGPSRSANGRKPRYRDRFLKTATARAILNKAVRVRSRHWNEVDESSQKWLLFFLSMT
ncbi:MAG: hypothetical protein MJZ64_03640 [Paludibacteraceae bacterium]|nr:hypothetical protein [Paludibacteraceae bacterium]